jgi:trans-aconitate methyltransferase
MGKYTFGTDDAGINRLGNMAAFWNPLASRFIQQHWDSQPCHSAVDLGCGPGFTTDMLAHTVPCDKVYGLDTSDHFLKAAATRFPAYTFIHHNLTQIPLPVQADVMYVRFVLSHLGDAVQIVNGWLTGLNPNGMLFIEETETVETEVEVFQQYLTTNAEMIADQGANLWVGATLAQGTYEAEVVSSICERVQVVNAQAATWFLPNIQTVWQTNAYVQAHLSPSEYQRIAAEVERIKESGDDRLQNTWRMRRLVLRRSK